MNRLAVVAGYSRVWADACAVGVDADNHAFNSGGAIGLPAQVNGDVLTVDSACDAISTEICRDSRGV